MGALTVALLHGTSVAAQASGELDAFAARSIVDGCAAHATTAGRSHAIAVVDAGGWLVAFLRMDGNTAGVGELAVRKAEAAAHWRFSTAEMRGAAEATPGFEDAPRVVTVEGGVPIFASDGTFLGAVGVSGEAPEHDAACARAGVDAAGLRTERR